MDIRNLYQELIMDHGTEPRNFSTLENASHSAEGYNPLCGDKIQLFLKIENECITKACFQGSGCAISTASASLMTEALSGKTVEEASLLFETLQTLITQDKHHDKITDKAQDNVQNRTPDKIHSKMQDKLRDKHHDITHNKIDDTTHDKIDGTTHNKIDDNIQDKAQDNTQNKTSTDKLMELGKLAALSGVQAFPARVKCATLPWHTLLSALKSEKV